MKLDHHALEPSSVITPVTFISLVFPLFSFSLLDEMYSVSSIHSPR